MNPVLAEWNASGDEPALRAMIACCGAERWARGMIALRPFDSAMELTAAADRLWAGMEEADWLEAFACHPRIGEREAARADRRSVAWSRQEQRSTETADKDVMKQIADGNARYEEKFGFTYIVCATGKSAEEMLAILTRRLKSDRTMELHEAAEQQRQIMQVRLRKWMGT